MSVTGYEDLLYGPNRRRGTSTFGGQINYPASQSQGGGAPRNLSGPVSRPTAPLPSQRTINRPTGFDFGAQKVTQRSAPADIPSGGGGLDAMINGAKNWGAGVMEKVGGRQKNGGNAILDYLANKEVEDLFASMPGAFSGDPMSFLSRAQQAIGDGGMSDALATIRNREEDYKKQAQQGDSRLAAMYDQLRNSILGDSETVGGITDEARKNMSEISDREREGITQAHQATQNRQNEVLSRLGIEDAAAIGLAQGDVQGRMNEQALNTATTRDAAAQQYTTSVGQNAQNLNTNNAAAAGLEGTSRRADLETQLQSTLARLRDEAASTQQDYTNRNMQMAMGLAGQMYDAARYSHQSSQDNWRDRFNLRQGMDDRAWDRDMQMRGMEQDAAAAAAEQNAIPWAQMSPVEQFNAQSSRMLGSPQRAAQAQSALSQAFQYDRTGKPSFDGATAVEALISQGFQQPEAIMLAQQYANSLGIR